MSVPVLGIILGDAAGSGPEIVAKLAASGFLRSVCRPLLLGDLRVFNRAAAAASVEVGIRVVKDPSDAVWDDDRLPFLDQGDLDPADAPFGTVSEASGRACIRLLEKGVRLFQAGHIAGFCFAPLNKQAMIQAGSPYESEHHYLAHLFGHEGPFGEVNYVDGLYTTRTTSHIPLRRVSEEIGVETIMRAVRLAHDTLTKAGIAHPRLGVAALNPHCGEGGKCGFEEIEVIAPAVERAKREGFAVFGPYSSDILFIKAFGGDFDGVVTMYHDQGQIALKLRGFDQGITIAGGLPAPIVTCAHGTASDIAGTGRAHTGAFENAVRIAALMAAQSERSGV